MKRERIDFFDPSIIALLIAAIMSDMLFIGILGLLIPGIGLFIFGTVLIVHYLIAAIIGAVLWKKVHGPLADTVFVLSLILPLPLLTYGIIAGAILSNRLIAFIAEQTIIQGAAIASGGFGEGLEVGAVAAEGAEVAAEGAGALAEAGSVAAEAGEAAAEAGEATAAAAATEAGEAASEAEEMGEQVAEDAMKPAAERPPEEEMENELFENIPGQEDIEAPEIGTQSTPESISETTSPSGVESEQAQENEPREGGNKEDESSPARATTPQEKVQDIFTRGHEIADRVDEGKDDEDDEYGEQMDHAA